MTDDFHFLFFAVGAFWFWRSLRSCLAMRQIPFLPPLPASPLRPWISVVLLVRNAAESIERTVRDLFAQRDVDLDLVVVDDRSEDDTAQKAEAAVPDADVHVEAIDEVPEGWLPRVHGLSQGLGAARGEWVLLLDRPVYFETNDVLARAVLHARNEHAASLWLVPRGRSSWLSPVALSAMVDSLPAMAATNRDRESAPWYSPLQLIRRDAVERIDWHDLRMNPLVESSVSTQLHERDLSMRTAQAADEVMVPQELKASFVLEMLERLFAAVGFQIAVLALALIVYGSIWVAAILGPFHENVWGLWAAGGLASQIVPAFMVAQMQNVPLVWAFLTPLTLPIELGLTAWAVMRAKLNRGVTWQGRFFSIDELRAAVQRERE